jgi:PEGA domain
MLWLLRGRQRRCSITLLTIVALALACSMGRSARADEARQEAQADTTSMSDRLERAATLATSIGEYAFAARALGQAYAITPDPEFLFAIAEAHRQRYALEARRYDLERALDLYRQYLGAAAAGRHNADAERSLEKLGPELEASQADAGADEAAAKKDAEATWLAISSPVSVATARLDGAAAVPLPAFVEIAPGHHVVVVSASGYEDSLALVNLTVGGIGALEVPLDRKLAHIEVAQPRGANVYVDSVDVGTAPLPRLVDVEPGRHQVTIAMGGHRTHSEELVLTSGATTKLLSSLTETPMRKLAWASIGIGAGGLVSGIVLGAVAIAKNNSAQDLKGRGDQVANPADQARYDDLIATRDHLRVGAGAASGIGLGLIVLGGVLHAVDGPSLPFTPKAREAQGSGASVDIVAGPGFAAATTEIRF